MSARLAGWLFAGPALLVIALFFGVPVLAALALSLTDFDIYALADIDIERGDAISFPLLASLDGPADLVVAESGLGSLHSGDHPFFSLEHLR